jgi:signal transduction histidine kinase
LKSYLKEILIVSTSLLIVQIVFFSIQISYEKSVSLTIQALVNQESVASNPYSITQGLENLESIGLIKCIKLAHNKRHIVYLDTSFKSSCHTGFFQLNGRALSSNVKAINGEIWNIDVISKNSAEFYLMLWLVRFFAIALGLSLLKLHLWRMNSLLHEKNLEIAKQNLKVESANHIAQIASQVSHDIRSPLAALKMAMEEVENLPSDYRNMIRLSVQRINDIANNLLNDNKTKVTTDKAQLEIELLAPLIDSLVSEKRMNYRQKTNINIEADLAKSYGLFAKVNSVELKRVLSNLINNSVEAMDSSGEVIVSVTETTDGKILLNVRDNGKGMPEQVLKKLGEKGFSHGKVGLDSGSGLGFYHAKETIESFGGKLEITSVSGEGTTISILLTKVAIPPWFVESLSLSSGERIFVLDDDESMLRAWSERLPLKTEAFTSGEEFSKSIMKLVSKDLLALVDYELLGQSQTGLELIQLLHIEKQSILVTSRFEEKELREKCNQLGVRLIPKMMAALIPIKYTTAKVDAIAPYDYVYIDDDELMRISWERKAKNKNLSLLVLSSTKELENHLDKISKDSTQFYIDSHLGEGEMLGEDFAKILHEQGYKHLSIASGYEEKHFVHLEWLKYSGKDCPF